MCWGTLTVTMLLAGSAGYLLAALMIVGKRGDLE
jgi:hypothetical protein